MSTAWSANGVDSEAVAGALERVVLGTGPTPIRRLRALEATSGPGVEIYCKDEGGYGARYGGNKTRKLEYTLAAAQATGRTTLLTFGGTGTNHGLATAIHARELGLRTVLLLLEQPDSLEVRRQLGRFRSLGVEVHRRRGVLGALWTAPGLMMRHGTYVVPLGGSSPLGTVGIVEAAREAAEQIRGGAMPVPTDVVVPLGSGGTAAGLLVGLRWAGLSTRVTGVLVTDRLPFAERWVLWLARRTVALLRASGRDLPTAAELGLRGRPAGFRIERAFVGPGYGHPTPESEHAVRLARVHEGLGLEAVYTGKAMAALLQLRARSVFGDGPVLYWHTHNAVPLDELDR